GAWQMGIRLGSIDLARFPGRVSGGIRPRRAGRGLRPERAHHASASRAHRPPPRVALARGRLAGRGRGTGAILGRGGVRRHQRSRHLDLRRSEPHLSAGPAAAMARSDGAAARSRSRPAARPRASLLGACRSRMRKILAAAVSAGILAVIYWKVDVASLGLALAQSDAMLLGLGLAMV